MVIYSAGSYKNYMYLFVYDSPKKTLILEINLFSELFMIFCCLVGIRF